MRQILIFILALTANLAVAQQNIEKITIPKGVVYNYCDNSIIEKAKKLIKENLTNENDYSLLQDNLIVGPTLWKTLKKAESLQESFSFCLFVHISSRQSL